MRKSIYLNLFLGLIACASLAQNPNGTNKGPNATTVLPIQIIGKLTGVVIDSEKKDPVEFATVALIDKATEKTIDGTTTDEKGKFTLGKIPTGTYKLLVTFIGYQTLAIDPVEIAEGRNDLNLGNVSLIATIKNLEAVTITEQKDLIEDKVDRIVYNADKDITNAGGTAEDVMRKVPMLSVDPDGNVQLRGSSNVRVLINNKPSTIMASNVADALKQIPANMIKSVEVITSPSAKYDAEGTAGIINIVTKKNNLQGISGSINAGGGNRTSNMFGNIGYKQGKLGLNLNTGTNLIYRPFDGYTRRNNFGGDTFDPSFLDQTTKGDFVGIFGNTQLGWDYEINPKNNLSGSVRFGLNRFHNNNLLATTLTNTANDEITDQFERNIDNKNRNNNIDLNFDYTRTFKKPNQEFSILALYSRSDGGNKYSLIQDENDIVNYQEKNDNTNTNQEITLQADYTHPISEAMTLEVGSKAILRKVTSNFDLFTYDFDDEIFVNNPERSNDFTYDQNVIASYISWGYNTKKKWGFRLGTRYEHTDIKGSFISDGTAFTQDFDNLIPSATISKDFKKGQKIRLNYSRRIQRPSIFFLNPYVNSADSLNISQGNPELQPELTNNLELSLSVYAKTSSMTISAYWRNTGNAITAFQTIDEEGVSTTTYGNIAENNVYGASWFGSTQPIKPWRISGNANIFYSRFDSPQQDNSGWSGNFNMNSSFDFGKGWSAQFFGMINLPRVELQGTRGTWSFYTMGIKKELFKKKGGITVGIDNVFTKAMKIRSNFESAAFRTASLNNNYARAFRIGFNYQFGKMNFNDRPKRKKSVNNDDLKQGENNNQ
jgi:outer membrane receptor protein involved in Fe transport